MGMGRESRVASLVRDSRHGPEVEQLYWYYVRKVGPGICTKVLRVHIGRSVVSSRDGIHGFSQSGF